MRRLSPKGRREAVLDAADRKRLREVATRCARCPSHEFHLHHVVYRAFKETRHDPTNHLPLCQVCHHYAHSHSQEFKRWFVDTYRASRPGIVARVERTL